VRYLEGLGYRVKVGLHVEARRGYLAGTDDQRVEDLNGMLRDRRVRAIFALRGGYGTPRLLPFVDYGAARRDPKIVVGYSDLTALQLALFRRAGLVSFSGPMLAGDFGKVPDPFTEENFWPLLTSTRRPGAMMQPVGCPLVSRRAGRAEGRILGGNLSLVASVLGTRFGPDYRGSLLVLEDVGERWHRLDRMFAQLRNAGILDRIAGLVLGRFTRCVNWDGRHSVLTEREVLGDVCSWAKVPAVEGFQYGHVAAKLTVPLGVMGRVDAGRGKVELMEAAVR
jgi:muramoyltetrapeptide carboxypeptidase